MPIIYHAETATFHLQNQTLSYLMTVLPSGHLGQMYAGARIRDRVSFGHLVETRPRPMSVTHFEDDPAYSLEHLKLEYPTYGLGDMRSPALTVTRPCGSSLVNLTYRRHAIMPGKPPLEGLPATYVEDDREAWTLMVELADDLAGISVALFYTIYEHAPVIVRYAEVSYRGEGEAVLERALSLSLDLPDMDWEMVDLVGARAASRCAHVARRHAGRVVGARVLQPSLQSLYRAQARLLHGAGGRGVGV